MGIDSYKKPHRAILVAEKCWVTARVLAAWLETGNQVAEVWLFGDTGPRAFTRATFSGRLCPDWDTGRLIARNGIPLRVCEKLTRWSDGAVERARAVGADVLLTVMTHQIVPEVLLAHFGRRAVNV